MTNQELIDELTKLDPDGRVWVHNDSHGPRWKEVGSVICASLKSTKPKKAGDALLLGE